MAAIQRWSKPGAAVCPGSKACWLGFSPQNFSVYDFTRFMYLGKFQRDY